MGAIILPYQKRQTSGIRGTINARRLRVPKVRRVRFPCVYESYHELTYFLWFRADCAAEKYRAEAMGNTWHVDLCSPATRHRRRRG